MKRGKPLERRTPLRNTTPMKRTGFKPQQAPIPAGGPKVAQVKKKPARKALKPVSAKRRAEEPDRRRAIAAVMFRSNGRCEISPVLARSTNPLDQEAARECRTYGTDGHEKLTRGRGGSITDPENILWTCRPCHDYVTDHPKEALALGLVESQYSPPIEEDDPLAQEEHERARNEEEADG